MTKERSGGYFDRFASWVSTQAARPWFFTLCFALVVVWVPSVLIVPDKVPGKIDTWQLVINTATTIITFLMVALLQNTQDRATRALHHKLDAIAEAVADVLDNTDDVDESGERAKSLRRIAGVEMEPSA
jgi:low affinity Fe/Cu permease